MSRYHLFRVFAGEDWSWGNPLAVFLDGAEPGTERRQAIAADLGLSETVFVDDVERAVMRIFTPASELPFAGHPSVGTSWLLRQLGHPVEVLRPPAGEVSTWADGDFTWIRARPEWVFPIDFEELPSPADVEAVSPPTDGRESWYPWAWIDEARGTLRSRYFVQELGIEEDQATGAAAVRLGARLQRELVIHQGVGSRLHVRPGPDGTVEVGGRCAGLEERSYDG
ncbi:MAG TPA: PhzF family phenazine biosynthesis protein [Candidatus Limnocylindrales bacterium]|jgi:predicted PhzF superfamily epimerase YddE/YHI9